MLYLQGESTTPIEVDSYRVWNGRSLGKNFALKSLHEGSGMKLLPQLPHKISKQEFEQEQPTIVGLLLMDSIWKITVYAYCISNM